MQKKEAKRNIFECDTEESHKYVFPQKKYKKKET